jgi:pyridinium-3,5-bisthiocarboxylic acid mononucleotide nickel chelatase
MRIAYLDCFSGISGDMFLGALVDAGVPVQLFEDTVAALNIGARLEISRVNRSGISATKVDVYCYGEKELPREEYWAQQAHKHELEHQHRHVHAHDHDHTHAQSHSHEHHQAGIAVDAADPAPAASAEAFSHSHRRSLPEIKKIISAASISSTAKQTAISIFQNLGAAEARVHSSDIENIHFHEVGAVDAMVDIVCAAVGRESLGVHEIVCSPLNVGGGTVKCAHGTFPIPAPATLELLKDAPVYSSGIQAELVTPTGAALVKALVTRFAPFPHMTVEKIGYGAGTRDFSGHANVTRITVGELQLPGQDQATSSNSLLETVSVLEANLDDLNPQVFGYVMDRLLAEGALDVSGTPVQMKKNRPGMLLTVLCKPADVEKLSQLVLRETTTLGVRQRQETRQVLSREWVKVSTAWGPVRMKIASMNGNVTNFAPEYEDCRHIASERGVPLKEVMQSAVQAYLQKKP